MSDALTIGRSTSTARARGQGDAGASRSWRRLVGYLGGFVLGAVLLIAAWAKLLDPVSFATTITAEGLDFLVSAQAVALFAIALEVGLGVALVLGVRRPWILWPSALLVLFFLFLTGRAYWRDLQGVLPTDTGCGCFGNLIERTPAEAFWQDLFLLGIPLALAFVARPRGGGFPKLRTAVVGASTLGAVLFAWRAPSLPLDNLATRLKPGVEVATLCSGKGDDRVCLDGVLPDLSVGEHVVVLTGLDEDVFLQSLDDFNERHWSGVQPPLWVLTAATDEERFQFRFASAPAFEPLVAPASLLGGLYRTLPRSFAVRDGLVTETWSGLPPATALEPSGAAQARH